MGPSEMSLGVGVDMLCGQGSRYAQWPLCMGALHKDMSIWLGGHAIALMHSTPLSSNALLNIYFKIYYFRLPRLRQPPSVKGLDLLR